MKFVGIDLGHRFIKWAILAPTKKGPIIEHLEYFPLPWAKDADKELATLEALTQIREAIKSFPCQVAISLPNHWFAYRRREFPFTERLKIQQALPFELEEDLPLSLDESFLDFVVTEQSGKQAQVLAAVTPKYHVENLMRSIGSLGLPLIRLIPASLALHNATHTQLQQLTIKKVPHEALEQGPPSLRMHIDVGFYYTLINVYQGDTWLTSTHLLWGTQNWTDEIARHYELDFTNSEKLLFENSSLVIEWSKAHYEQIVFTETANRALAGWIQDIKLFILQLESDYHAQVAEIQISGSVTQLAHLAPYLTQKWERVTNIFDPLTLWAQNPGLSHKPFFPLALGAALELAKPPTAQGFQFLQGAYAPKDEFFANYWKKAKLPVLWASAGIASFWIASFTRLWLAEQVQTQAEQHLKKTAAQILALPEKQVKPRTIKNYLKEVSRLSKDRQTYASIVKKPDSLTLFKNHFENFPKKLGATPFINEIRLENKTATLDIVTQDLNQKLALKNYLSSLDENKKAEDLMASRPDRFQTQIQLRSE